MCAAVATSNREPLPRVAVGGVIATGAALAGAAAYLAIADPADAGWLPSCPFHALTGWWCPGCGLTRATHHLLRGDVPAALANHLFVPVVLAAIAVGWWSTLRVSLGRPPVVWTTRVPSVVWVGLVAAMLAFAVLRNIPTFAALGP